VRHADEEFLKSCLGDVRPPRGVKPAAIWLEDRITDVCRALSGYVEACMYQKAEELSVEIWRLFQLRKWWYEQEKVE